MSRMKSEECEPNMTPMIDIVFLLISFFTLVINFSQSESNDRIHLPTSELAQPPEDVPTEPMTIQISEDGQIFVGQAVCYLDLPGYPKRDGRPLSDFFTEELRVRKTIDKTEPSDLTIIIRADADAETGFVERVIQACQAKGMENFTLRARQVVE